MDSLHNLPDGKLCRLSVRHYCRTASYVDYPSGSSAGQIADNLPSGCRTDSHCLH